MHQIRSLWHTSLRRVLVAPVCFVVHVSLGSCAQNETQIKLSSSRWWEPPFGQNQPQTQEKPCPWPPFGRCPGPVLAAGFPISSLSTLSCTPTRHLRVQGCCWALLLVKARYMSNYKCTCGNIFVKGRPMETLTAAPRVATAQSPAVAVARAPAVATAQAPTSAMTNGGSLLACEWRAAWLSPRTCANDVIALKTWEWAFSHEEKQVCHCALDSRATRYMLSQTAGICAIHQTKHPLSRSVCDEITLTEYVEAHDAKGPSSPSSEPVMES